MNDATHVAQQLAARGITIAPRGTVLRLAAHFHTIDDDIDAVCNAMCSLTRAAA